MLHSFVHPPFLGIFGNVHTPVNSYNNKKNGSCLQHGTQGGIGWVWIWDWDIEVAEPTVISLLNQTMSITRSKLPHRAL